MDCLRSFSLNIRQTGTFTGAGVVKSWGTTPNIYWACNVSGVSQFNVQGFKNIDLYSVVATGNVYSQIAAPTGGVIVDDWSFDIFFDGQLPQISGVVNPAPNFWNLQLGTVSQKTFAISKYTNTLNFADPIKSLKTISFQNLLTQGTGGQTASTVSLDYDLSFTFFYKYEGE